MSNITLKDFEKAIRNVPDFPKPGIMFKDITTALKEAKILNFVADSLYEYYKDKKITKVAGIESRGFILGGILASRLNAGFVLIRKPGKLPADTYQKAYSLEYGEDKLEIHKDAIFPNDIVLLHDDLLATGGSAGAALELIRMTGANNVFLNFLIELEFLSGRSKFEKNIDIFSLIKY
jgi:adenine phosphoribosyltransferase